MTDTAAAQRQLDLFQKVAVAPISPALKQEMLFGERDAGSGRALMNTYSKKLWGDRLMAYTAGYHQAVANLRKYEKKEHQ